MIEAPTCIVCAGREVSALVRIEHVPVLSNWLWDNRDEALEAPTARVSLGLCRTCGHVFSLEFDSDLVQYGPEYENSLQYSGRFREYDDALIDALIEQYGLRGRTIVEIGCGRGDFLKALCRRGGNRGVGFDPGSTADDEECRDSGCKVVIRRERYEVGSTDLDADFICSRQTLEHIGEPRAFLAGMRSATRRSGVPVFVEVPNSLYTLRDGGIWDIIYEHCSYFCTSSLAWLFRECGYRIVNVTEAFGGQFLTVYAETCAETSGRSAETAVASTSDFTRFAATFAAGYRRKVDEWTQRLDVYEREGQRVVVWGAGAKGTMFLNTLRRGKVEYVVDLNPRKQGKYVTGSGQQIVAPEFLREYRPDVIICMNPNYLEEMERQSGELGLTPAFALA